MGRASPVPPKPQCHIYTYFLTKSREGVLSLVTAGAKLKIMEQEALLISLFFTFALGAGIGYYIARFLF